MPGLQKLIGGGLEALLHKWVTFLSVCLETVLVEPEINYIPDTP